MANRGRVLDGIRVLDIGTFVFGPAAATVLADFGAEVVKVENPRGGDTYRYLVELPPMPASEQNYCWILTSRGKRSLALDLKREEGREVLLELVQVSDVLITNHHPSVLADLRLRYEDLAPLNERLVYAHATGYGDRGDEIEKPGYDMTAWWARSGLMDAVRPGQSAPALSVAGMGDHPAAMSLFGAILLALYRRERTGRGGHVSTSLMANGAWSNACLIQAELCGAETYAPADRTHPPNALVNPYRTSDDRWFVLVLVQEAKDWEPLCRAIGRSDLLADARFSELDARHKHAAELTEILDGVFATKRLDEWRAILDAHGVTFGIVSRAQDLVDDATLAANGVLVPVADPRATGLRTVSSPLELRGEEKVQPSLAPGIGEHSREILASVLGYSPERIRELLDAGVVTGT
jgi:formyl-CoA transferase